MNDISAAAAAAPSTIYMCVWCTYYNIRLMMVSENYFTSNDHKKRFFSLSLSLISSGKWRCMTHKIKLGPLVEKALKRLRSLSRPNQL